MVDVGMITMVTHSEIQRTYSINIVVGSPLLLSTTSTSKGHFIIPVSSQTLNELLITCENNWLKSIGV